MLLVLTACPSSSEGTPEAGSTGDVPDDTTSTTGPPVTTIPDPSTTSTSTTTGESTGLPEGDGCCQAHAGPGCNEAAVQMCVCELDASCCGFDWSAACAGLATDSCSATCMPDPPDTTTGRTSDPSSDSGGSFASTGEFDYESCCVPHGGLGCWHEPTQTCACAIDATCCDTEWNENCVTVATDNCMVCNTDDCCAPQADAGCSDETVQTCVCDLDPFCCSDLWDEICIDAALAECKLTCPTEPEPRRPPGPGSTTE